MEAFGDAFPTAMLSYRMLAMQTVEDDAAG
jgi:hypothetical protein